MGFKSFINKAKEEYKERAEIEKAIKQKAKNEALLEREKQMIRVARAKERIKADRQISALKSGKSGFSSFLDAVSPPRPMKKKKSSSRKSESYNIFGGGGYF